VVVVVEERGWRHMHSTAQCVSGVAERYGVLVCAGGTLYVRVLIS